MSLVSLNLSLSSFCAAHCVFCPEERGEFDPGCMEIGTVETILEQALPFKDTIKTVQVGENGDPLLNRQLVPILQLIRAGLPGARINMATNLFCMREPMSQTLLEGRLLDGLQLNIDGHDAASYEAQKGVSYDRVIQNLKDLVRVREEVWPDFRLEINVLPLSDYVALVRGVFGEPWRLSSEPFPTSSFDLVRESLSWLPASVRVRKSPIFAWAERYQPREFDLSTFQCPQLPRVEREAFISPSGWWYPCCMDADQDQRFGNVHYQSLSDIFRSEERSRFLERLKSRDFEGIGYPCNRVPFCQVIG